MRRESRMRGRERRMRGNKNEEKQTTAIKDSASERLFCR